MVARLRTLVRHADHELTGALRDLAERHRLTNVFNPSLVVDPDGRHHIAFRAETTPGERPFRALLTTGPPDALGAPLDLSEHVAGWGITPAADPKLVRLGDEVFAVLNTGYQRSTPNEVVLLRVGPTLGPPQRCVLDPRQTVEKNWAFHLDRTGRLCALYSVDPAVVLHHVGGELGTEEPLELARADAATDIAPGAPTLSIGTQLAWAEPGSAHLVAHEKVRIGRRRAYLGRLVHVRLDAEGGPPQVTVGRDRLAHSARALVPPRTRHNPSLLSATYVSGLAVVDDALVLGYGVNDLDFGFARIPRTAPWR